MSETGFDLESFIMHHVRNSDHWNVPFVGPVALPPHLTLHGFMILVWAFLLIVIFCFAYQRKARVPTGMTNLLETLIIFIRDEISISCLGHEDGRKMAPLFITFFFFIVGLNLLGLIPLFATATSNVNVTGALAIVTLCFMIFGSIYKNGFVGFIKSFIPSGVPVPVLVIVTPIEFVGMFIKAFALMIRLFANMLAGHIVVLALVGLVGLLGFVALPSVILAVFILILEVFVSFLQAYIFTLLSAMFMGQMYHPEH